MDEKTLNVILTYLPFAYAYHRMVYDDQGKPIDYVFIEINRAFEKLTSLKREAVIGHSVTEVIPGIRNDPANWIGVYGDLVRNGEPLIFKQYAKYLDKWFNVYALSADKDHFVTLFMDITKMVEEQNEQTELFRAMNDIILELDEEMNILRVLMAPDTPIPLPVEQPPVALEKLIGMNAVQFLEQEGSRDFTNALMRAKETNQKVLYYQHMLLNNQDAWYQLMVKSLTMQGKPRYIISIINMTEQKLLENQLMEKEALFQTVFEQAPVGISITKKDENLYANTSKGTSVNQAYIDILGRSREELATLHWTDITHPDDLAADTEHLRQLLSGQVDHYQMEKRYFKPDGSTIWVNFIASTLKNQIDENISHLCLLEDITQRKTLEQSLRESERSKSVLLSHLPGLAYRCLNDLQ